LSLFLISLIIVSIFLYHLYALHYGSKIIKYLLKPGTMVLIIVLAIHSSTLETTFAKWVVLALIFSVFGDIFLMLENRWFMHGLISFFLAHIAYIIAFWNSFTLNMSSQTSLIVAICLLIFSAWFYLFLLDFVLDEGGLTLALAVASYIIVISMMMWSASLVGTSIVIVASLLFVISDSILAYDKFRRPFKLAEHLVMITYFTAQLLFALSVG